MNSLTIKPGWADKLKEGSTVFVHTPGSHNTGGKTPTSDYEVAKVERVTATEVHVNGNRYRRGKGRSARVAYQNEGFDIDRLLHPRCPKIYPYNAATRRWLEARDAARAETAALVALVSQVRSEVSRAFETNDTDRLKAALRALTRKKK